MKRQSKDILYFEISSQNKPTLRVQAGEEFEVQTQLNRGPFTDEHPEGPAVAQKLRGGNPSSGCIWVEGAEPGDLLSVHIGQISLDPVGFTAFRGRYRRNAGIHGLIGPWRPFQDRGDQ